MATILDIKLPKAIAAALRIPPNDPRRQQLRVLKKLLKKQSRRISLHIQNQSVQKIS